MNIIEKAMTRKGQIATIDIRRPVKMLKGFQPVIKESTIQVRLGVNYDNIADVKDKREAGELPAQNSGLPYGQWVIPNLLLEHNGVQYLRCTAMDSKMKVTPKYYRDGNEVPMEIVKKEALASEFSDKKDIDVFNVKVDNIISIR